jgi:hypothetical protein
MELGVAVEVGLFVDAAQIDDGVDRGGVGEDVLRLRQMRVLRG